MTPAINQDGLGDKSTDEGLLHTPVLVKETMELLAVKKDGTYLDGTVGLGGHAAAILSFLGPEGKLIGIDRDDKALSIARKRLGNGRVTLAKGNFSAFGAILASFGVESVHGILFDLGISMLQLKEPGRGFSFYSDARLDMRMDPTGRLTAWDIVNTYHERELEWILKQHGDEPLARRIARAIVKNRDRKSINTCAELADLVAGVYGKRGRTHPATRTFQAVRIEVNREQEELKEGLDAALRIMRTGGRVCVISYHSIEDRVVKNFFRDQSRAGLVRILTKKPIVPGFLEARKNPSSRSAKLRGAERI